MKLEQIAEQMEGPRPYYILAVFNKEDGYWEMVFGDYDRKLVKAEAEEFFGQRKKILRTGDSQKAVEAAMDQLNGSA